MDEEQDKWDAFEKDRLDTLLSLDVEKMRAYLAKYDEIPSPNVSDETLLAGMHYARINANFIPEDAKEVSAKWLTEHNYRLKPLGF